ncbi:MAG: biotin--[acetyl-CoA-carboxylase] ligase [FCB group bacterium]|nr:biotin--[acetyl-CoA-carboxylase] ligase [FCB group bacterium]
MELFLKQAKSRNMLFTNLIQTNLLTDYIGRTIEYYPSIDSTNAKAWSLISSHVRNGTLIITDHQSAGRGRGKHTWISSPERSLTFSITLYPAVEARLAGIFPLLAGVTICKTLSKMQIHALLKWPNDIFLNGKKIGGILCESKISGAQIRAVVCGVGLNVNETKSDFPKNLHATSSSLRMETGRYYQRELILASILNDFDRSLNQLSENGPQPIINSWIGYCAHLNETVKFHDGNQITSGKFIGLSKNGEAILLINGTEKRFKSGTVMTI